MIVIAIRNNLEQLYLIFNPFKFHECLPRFCPNFSLLPLVIDCEAIGDRLLQRLMLAKEQHPVNISRAGVALINNVMGFLVVPWGRG